MARNSKKNLHLEHLEDDIINLGYDGAKQAIDFSEAMLQLFDGHAARKIDITTKWDGAPAVVCGKDPESGMFFVATKHAAFAKDMRLAFSEEHIDFYYEGKEILSDTLKIAFRELKDLGWNEVMQGDIMFTTDMKKIQVVDGINSITFKPNTIMYTVPREDPLGQFIDTCKLGVVFHTKFTGKGPVNGLSPSFGASVNKLKKTTTAWVRDAKYQDVSGKLTLTDKQRKLIETKLISVKANVVVAKTLLNTLSKQESDLSVGYLFKIFVNTLVRAGTPITDRSLSGVTAFIISRIEEREKGVKQQKAIARYAGIKKETQTFLKNNARNMSALISIYTSLLTIKNIFVDKLNEAQEIKTFIETPQGFKHTDPEGYVAVDNKGNAVKLVNRMEFSQANFNAVKDWSKPETPPVLSKQKLRTLVLTYGRLNPPTIGHKKLIDKVLAVATREEADHLIVLSHSHDKKTNPLTGVQKLNYASLLFPSATLELSTALKPNIFSYLTSFNEKYDKVIIVVGSDRVEEFKKKTAAYNGSKLYTYKILDVESAGERDPDADGAKGMSASKMREFAKKADFENFKKGLPPTLPIRIAQQMMADVQQGLA